MEASAWAKLSVLDKVQQVLEDVSVDDHHFGRRWVTAYQLAILLDERYPEVGAELGLEVGGAGTGSHTSLSQYLARQLSGLIKAEGDRFPVEGAFLSNEHVASLNFVGPGGATVTSSLTDSGYDLSMFRVRAV
ncbi:hypothetical protein [Amycolatopsis sp. NPDC004378]